MGKQFVIEVEEGPSNNTVFSIREEDPETISRIREQHCLRETAFFHYEEISLKNLVFSNLDHELAKKVSQAGTVKSIEMEGSQRSIDDIVEKTSQ